MIVTHEWTNTDDTRYSVRRLNGGDPVAWNYFPSMYDYDTPGDFEVIGDKHIHVLGFGAGALYRVEQPAGPTYATYRMELRTTEPRPDYVDENEGGYLFSFGGLDIMRGRALRFPADGQWHFEQFVGRLDPASATTTIAFNASTISSPNYEIRNLQIVYDDAQPYDAFNGNDRSYSTTPARVYDGQQWATYNPVAYIDK